MNNPSSITKMPAASTGLNRKWRRLCWSLRRRLCPSSPIVLDFDQGLYIEVTPRERLGLAIRLNGYSDREQAELLHRYLKPGMTYFDIGAHFGQFSLIASKLVGSEGKVHCFEATKYTYDQLIKNIELNKASNINPNYNAIFNKPDTLEIQVCVPGKGEFNALGKPLRPEDQVIGVEKVPAITLDDYCKEHGIDQIDLMKIDTNGAELQVLQGAERILSAANAPALVCEFNDTTFEDMGYTPADIKAEFAKLGYKLYRPDLENKKIVEEPTENNYPDTVDLLAIKDIEKFNQTLTW